MKKSVVELSPPQPWPCPEKKELAYVRVPLCMKPNLGPGSLRFPGATAE